MKVVSSQSFSFLKERTVKFCVVMSFTSIWLLVLAIYYSKGQSTMSALQTSVYQFIIFTNLMTLTLFLAAAALQAISIRREVTYKCSSVMVEISALVFVIVFQTVAAIALSAATPSFACTADGSCRESIFFAIVAWIAPLLFTAHAVEFILRARRAAAVNPSVWSTPTWLIQWDQVATPTKDLSVLERGISISGPKALILPVHQAKKASANNEKAAVLPLHANNNNGKDVLAQVVAFKTNFLSKDAYSNLRGKKRTSSTATVLAAATPGPVPPPKTPSSADQVIVIIPSKVQYSVPRLGPAPRYFIQIPDNIQYTVPRISKPPCPKQLAKDRKRARSARPKTTRVWGRAK